MLDVAGLLMLGAVAARRAHAARDAPRSRAPDRRDHAAPRLRLRAVARPSGATFRDVQAAAESLEQAKTALRALGKYVPLDLVRQLYDARARAHARRPRSQDVTLLFSDIEGFTTIVGAARAERARDRARRLPRRHDARDPRDRRHHRQVHRRRRDGAVEHAAALLDATPSALAPRRSPAATATEALFAEPRLARPRAVAHPLRHPPRRGDRRPLRRPRSHELHRDGRRGEPRLATRGPRQAVRRLGFSSAPPSRPRRAAPSVSAASIAWRSKASTKGSRSSSCWARATALRAARARRGATSVRSTRISRSDFDAALALLDGCAGDQPSEVLAARCRRFLAEPPPGRLERRLRRPREVRSRRFVGIRIRDGRVYRRSPLSAYRELLLRAPRHQERDSLHLINPTRMRPSVEIRT